MAQLINHTSIEAAFGRAEIMVTIPRTDGRDAPRPLVYGRRTQFGWIYCVAATDDAKRWVRAHAPRAR